MEALIKKAVVSALALESRMIVRKHKPFVVAVTGSVGKTSTKDALYDVMKDSGMGVVRKSEKGFNSEIGLSLAIIGAPNAWYDPGLWLKNLWKGLKLALWGREYPSCLILEVGADHPGDIRRVTKWLHPDIAVVTRVSRTPAHVEFFLSPEAVFEEKAHLAAAVKPGGSLVVYADDERTLSLGGRVKEKGVSVVSYGLSDAATVRGSDIAVEYGPDGAPAGMKLKISAGGESREIRIAGAYGESYAYTLLAAAAAAFSRKMSLAQIVGSLERYDAPKGRMNIISGLNGSTLIDDSYNSSPDAASAALSALKAIEPGTRPDGSRGARFAVLGDMLELGKFAAQEHRRIGVEAAAALGPDGVLVTVGQRSRLTAEEAVKSGMAPETVRSFDSAREAVAYLAPLARPGDVILVKGSQSMRMERVSAALLREPEKAGTLLVRQEKEWLAKP